MIKRIAILVLLALLVFSFVPPPLPVQAAIAQTAWATQVAALGNPITMAFDCNGGNFLVLGLCIRYQARAAGPPTYNGVAMTASPEGVVDSGSESIVEMWYLVNPAGGVNDISIPHTGGDLLVPIASAWSGVDTADPFDTSNSAWNAGSANPSVLVNTANAFELVIDVMGNGNSTVPSANSHTLISSQDNGNWTSNAQYTTAQTPAGNITLHYTVALDDNAMIVCAFKVDTGAPPSRRIFLIH